VSPAVKDHAASYGVSSLYVQQAAWYLTLAAFAKCRRKNVPALGSLLAGIEYESIERRKG